MAVSGARASDNSAPARTRRGAPSSNFKPLGTAAAGAARGPRPSSRWTPALMVLKELGVRGTHAVFFHSTKRDRVVFVEEVPPSLVCPVCHDALKDPLVAGCGHPACAECVEKVVRQTGKCFSCSDVVSPNDYVVDHLSNVKLGDLRVLCRNAIGLRESEAVFDDKHASRADRTDKSLVEVYVRRDEFNETACASSVPLRDLEAHEETCAFRTLMCDLCDVEERGEDGAEDPVSSDGSKPENGGPCGFVCVLRDMPFHRSTCDNRVTNCSFASFGCEWRGSVRRLDAHRRACRFQPRPCPNGCGAEVSVGSMMMKHLDVCPLGEVACDAPDAEEDPDDPAPARCAAIVRRRDLARHRKEECEFARASRCRRCRALVSLRSAATHAETRCAAAREPCPRDCGASLSKSEIEAHLRERCPRVVVDCPFKDLGCDATAERGSMDSHLRLAAGAHLELLRAGLLAARETAAAFRRDAESHGDRLTRAVEERRAESLAALAARESSVLRDLGDARERDGETRARLAREVETLKRAMADQTATYGAQLLETFNDARDLRLAFDAFRTKTERELSELRAAVDANKDKAVALFEDVSERREVALGKYEKTVDRALEDEERRWRADVDRQTRALRGEFEDYKFGVEAKMRELWEAMRSAGRRFAHE